LDQIAIMELISQSRALIDARDNDRDKIASFTRAVCGASVDEFSATLWLALIGQLNGNLLTSLALAIIHQMLDEIDINCSYASFKLAQKALRQDGGTLWMDDVFR